jgi:hypothetical protein
MEIASVTARATRTIIAAHTILSSRTAFRHHIKAFGALFKRHTALFSLRAAVTSARTSCFRDVTGVTDEERRASLDEQFALCNTIEVGSLARSILGTGVTIGAASVRVKAALAVDIRTTAFVSFGIHAAGRLGVAAATIGTSLFLGITDEVNARRHGGRLKFLHEVACSTCHNINALVIKRVASEALGTGVFPV